MQPSVGQQIGGFELIEHVASGRADVFRATAGDGTEVALKIWSAEADSPSEPARLARFDGNHIATYVDHGQSNDRHWMATRWIEGRTLAHLLDTEGPLTVDRAARLVTQAAEAIDSIHDKGLVHGDLSPDNMMVDFHDRLAVIDLGESQHGADDPATTTTVDVRTTPRYASPEVAAGGAPSAAGDRYALALVAYEALTGSSPFPEAASASVALRHHLVTEPTPPSEERPSLAPEFDDLFALALAKDPSVRPASASTFAAALAELHPGSDSIGGSAPRRRFGRSTTMAATAVVVVICALTVAVFALRNDDGEAAEQANWAAGTAAGASCNLMEMPGFEQGEIDPADNFYSFDAGAAAVRLVPGAGVDGSVAARIGATGKYTLYGLLVPVDPDETYVFASWVRHQGEPTLSNVFVDYLDANFDTITDNRLDPAFDDLLDRQRIEHFSTSPSDAAWAVPTFFKDGSSGSMLVDEVIFGAANECGNAP